MGVRNYRDLIVWKLADELRANVDALGQTPALSRDFRYRDQLASAAASDFARFLTIARASLAEVDDRLHHGVQRGYLSAEEYERLFVLTKRTATALGRLRSYLLRH